MTPREPGTISYPWQGRIAESGLQELLGLAQQVKDSGLFDEKELASILSELKQVSVLMAKNLITHLTEEAPDTRPPVKIRELREKEFSEVRGRLNRLGKTLDKIG